MTFVQAVGIDLGTTNSAIALVGDDGQARPIPNAEGMLTTPSVALWDGDTPHGLKPRRLLAHHQNELRGNRGTYPQSRGACHSPNYWDVSQILFVR